MLSCVGISKWVDAAYAFCNNRKEFNKNITKTPKLYTIRYRIRVNVRLKVIYSKILFYINLLELLLYLMKKNNLNNIFKY